mmetsp:Transcript_14456/g.33262  ORF Transcript_14456/g.33262 Transcript_14456/m.33262 type:complete len:120 (+) Transcript_14456:306-665(+)
MGMCSAKTIPVPCDTLVWILKSSFKQPLVERPAHGSIDTVQATKARSDRRFGGTRSSSCAPRVVLVRLLDSIGLDPTSLDGRDPSFRSHARLGGRFRSQASMLGLVAVVAANGTDLLLV